MVNLGYQLSWLKQIIFLNPPPPLPSNAASQLFLKLPPFYFLTSLMMIYASGKTVDTKDGFSQIRLFTVNYMLIYFWKNHFSWTYMLLASFGVISCNVFGL